MTLSSGLTIIKLWGVCAGFNLIFREERAKGGVAMVAQAIMRDWVGARCLDCGAVAGTSGVV